MQKNKIKAMAMVEIVFDICYLAFAAIFGVYMLAKSDGRQAVWLFGVLALVLCGGDAFHLVPRVGSLLTNSMAQHRKSLGFGKMITSVTMTIFYVIIYYLWLLLSEKTPLLWLTAVILGLALVRIVLCLLPQNGWQTENPSYKFAIYRNIPFVILGAIIAFLFANNSIKGFEMMPFAIVLSFVFYLIVVLFAGKKKALGAFMLPKTCTYVWILCMGLSLL